MVPCPLPEAFHNQIEALTNQGRLQEALQLAQYSPPRGYSMGGEDAFPTASYAIAHFYFNLRKGFEIMGELHRLRLSLLSEAQRRFGILAQEGSDSAAARMQSVCYTDLGDCFFQV